MNDIKLIVTDMDGTLVPLSHYEAPESVIRKVKELQDAGIRVAVVTGRPYSHAKDLVKELGIEGLGVFSGGASVIDVTTDEIIWKQWLPKEYLRTIMGILTEHCTEIAWNPEHDTDTLDLSMELEDSQYVFGIYDPEKESILREVIGELPDIDVHYFDGYHPITKDSVRALHITHILATKHHGVEVLRKMDHVPIENTLAIGDGDNDIALFRSAGVKIAMGNASDDLKNVADHIVETIDDDGWIKAMDTHVLNK